MAAADCNPVGPAVVMVVMVQEYIQSRAVDHKYCLVLIDFMQDYTVDFAAIHIRMFTMVVVELSQMAVVEVHVSQICFFRELVVHWKEWSKEFVPSVAQARASQICFFRVLVHHSKEHRLSPVDR